MTTSSSTHSECATANHKVESLDESLKGLLITAPARVLNIAEIRENFMLQLDPSTLLRLISVSPAALATFERDSVKFIDAAFNNSDISSRRWAIAILKAYWKRPDDDIKIQKPDEDLPFTRTHDGRPLTELDSFLIKFVKFGDDRSLPADIPRSLESLRKLASVHDAASDLLESHLWTGIDNPEMCDINSANVWTALWIYQLYCELFHRPGNAGSPDVLFPSVEAQRKYLRIIRDNMSLRSCIAFAVSIEICLVFLPDCSMTVGPKSSAKYTRTTVSDPTCYVKAKRLLRKTGHIAVSSILSILRGYTRRYRKHTRTQAAASGLANK